MQLLWPGRTEPDARRALRNALYTIRVALGRDVVVSIGEHLVGINPRVLGCDALDLERMCVTGSLPLRTSDISPLWDFGVDHAEPFNQWAHAERERINDLVRSSASQSTVPYRPPTAHARAHAIDPYTLYLRGHYLFLRAAHGGAPSELERSRTYFERALAEDPSFGPALAGLSNYYAVSARRGTLENFHQQFGRAIEFSHRAAELDPNLAIPHVHFAVRAMYLDDDWARAGSEFSTAVRNEPEYAEAHRFYGVWLGMDGRVDEALSQMEIAVKLEPDIPHMWSSLGAARAAVGDTEGALVALRETLSLDARHQPARARLVRVLEDSGQFVDALAERRNGANPAAFSRYAAGWEARGEAGYREVMRAELREAISALEARLLEGDSLTVNDIFSPPTVRLVELLARAEEWGRARAWRLQACAARPGLRHWFDGLPELRAAPKR